MKPINKREKELNDIRETISFAVKESGDLREDANYIKNHKSITDFLALDKQTIKNNLDLIEDPKAKQVITYLTKVVYALCLDTLEDETE